MKYIFNSPLKDASLESEEEGLATQLAENGLLESDQVDLEALSQEAADVSVKGRYDFNTDWSQMFAEELEELADSALKNVPLFRPNGRFEKEGYYEIQSADIKPLHPTAPSIYQFSLSLKAVGTRSSHQRALDVTERTVANPFGSDSDRHVGLPGSAKKVRWVDGSAVEKASPVESFDAEFGSVDVYEISDGEDAVDGDDPLLVYDVSYLDDVESSVRVYDTRGFSTKFTGGGTRRWETVHSTTHEVEEGDRFVLDTGTIRLYLDEDAGTIRYREWNGSSFSTVISTTDRPSGVELYDVDINQIGMVRDEVQLTFDVDGTLYALDASVQRGRDTVLFSIPQGESDSVPSDLEDWLEPAASTTEKDMMPTKTLIKKSELRK